MSQAKRKRLVKQVNRSFNERQILTNVFNPTPFDPSLTSNPFLRDQQQYQYLVHKMKQFNKLAAQKQVKDSYEAMIQDRLRSLMIVIGNLLTRDLQIEKLKQVYEWFKKEQYLVQQRLEQGKIRYKVTKSFLEQMKSNSKKQQPTRKYESVNMNNLIPSQLMAYQKLPYLNGWRTAHKQIQIPEERLKQYNRKSINVDQFSLITTKKQVPPKITYPKLGKLKYVKQYQVEEGIPEENTTNINIENPQSPQKKDDGSTNPADSPENKLPDIQEMPQIQGQDLGLGEQPQEEPQQEQEQQQLDKLAPRIKSFILQQRIQSKQQKFSHKRMGERYVKIQNDFVKKQREDSQIVQLMNSWAARKSQLNKQIMKRIENMGLSYRQYKLSYQDPEKQQVFSIEDAKKYGLKSLSKTFEIKDSKSNIDISGDLQFPSINNKSDMFQKSIKKDKLKSLKKRFGDMLKLQDYENRQVAQSMCQVTKQRKGFSQILKKHSKSKERLKQLDQAIRLKQSLAKEKIAIDISTLSKSLCSPEEQQDLPVEPIPIKQLLSNPFWVEPAKKKKKKK